jgi:hypothetical protein
MGMAVVEDTHVIFHLGVQFCRLLEARPDGQGQKLPSASGFQQWRQAIWKVYVKEAG